jgi:hypothetical protein
MRRTRLAASAPRNDTWIRCSGAGGGGGPIATKRFHRVSADVGLRGVLEVLRGALLHHLHVAVQPTLLVLPPSDGIAEQLLAVCSRCRKPRVRPAVHPAAVAFDAHDLGGHPFEQRTVVAHHQHGRLGGEQLLFQPDACRDVEVVVGLVEQQHVGIAGEEQVEHQPLAFTARQLTDESRGHVVDRGLHAALGGRVPARFELVAAEIAPRREGLAVVGGTGLTRGQCMLGGDEVTPGIAQRSWRDGEQQVAHAVGRSRHADVLGHGEHVAADRPLALVGIEIAGEDAQDRALADAVRTDEHRALARRDREADVEEQRVGGGRSPLQLGHHDAAHRCCHRPIVSRARVIESQRGSPRHRVTCPGSSSASERTPSNFIVRRISSARISIARATPAAPPAMSPYR